LKFKSPGLGPGFSLLSAHPEARPSRQYSQRLMPEAVSSSMP
jgi:hypothetical protein